MYWAVTLFILHLWTFLFTDRIKDHIYRMVIVEGRCTKLQLLISYIYNHWLTQKYSEFWLLRYNGLVKYCCTCTFTILYIWSLDNTVLLLNPKPQHVIIVLKKFTHILYGPVCGLICWKKLVSNNFEPSWERFYLVIVIKDDVVELEWKIDNKTSEIENWSNIHMTNRAARDGGEGICKVQKLQ